MLWFFDRNDQSVCLETRYDNESAEFVAVVRWPSGDEQLKRFADAEAFRLWLVAFEQAVKAEQWLGRSGPIVLPYGWPNKRPM
jgi:hypothetical protein